MTFPKKGMAWDGYTCTKLSHSPGIRALHGAIASEENLERGETKTTTLSYLYNATIWILRQHKYGKFHGLGVHPTKREDVSKSMTS
jgi:hypothetical protein